MIRPSVAQVEEAIRTLIAWLGCNPDDVQFRNTPEKISGLYDMLYQQANLKIEKNLNFIENNTCNLNTIKVTKIPCHSLCPHHLLPFMGHIDISYTPATKIVTLGSIFRLIKISSAIPQMQEDLTGNILYKIKKYIQPAEASVSIAASHTCSYCCTNHNMISHDSLLHTHSSY